MERKQLRIVKPSEISSLDSVYIDADNMEDMVLKSGISKLALDGVEEMATAPTKEQFGSDEALYASLVNEESREHPVMPREMVTSGGMGVLYMADERDLQRRTMLKVILPDRRLEPGLAEAFLREARITSQLQHPAIVPIYRLGYLPDLGPYYTMRRIEGQTLLSIIDELIAGQRETVEAFTEYRMLEIFKQVCEAIRYAHDEGIVHRDVKPANIMIGKYGGISLLDWGMAKEMPTRRRRQPEPDMARGKLRGTPAYMAPEQARGDEEQVGTGTDIWLLGATLYHMLYRQPLYTQKDVQACVRDARGAQFTAPGHRSLEGFGVSRHATRIMKQCLNTQPDRRYRTVEMLLADVSAVLENRMQSRYQTFKKDEQIIRAGEDGDCLYYIVSGEAVVYSENKLGLTKEIARLGPGEIVGELALINDSSRVASVKASKTTRVMVVDREDFAANLDRLEPWTAQLISSLASRLATANQHNRDLHVRPGFLRW